MKKIIVLLFFLPAYFGLYSQCSTVGVQVNSSDTTYIQLYHAGFFNIPNGIDNIVEWTVTAFDGTVIFQDTTSGDFNDQSNAFFNHSVPITDSMKATILITNNTEGITCTMNDTLFWEETEVIPGAFIGNWAVLSDNGGVEASITTSADLNFEAQNIKLYPALVYDNFQIEGDQDTYSLTILDVNGQVLGTYNNVRRRERVNISHYSSGMFFVQFRDKNDRIIGAKKIIKI